MANSAKLLAIDRGRLVFCETFDESVELGRQLTSARPLWTVQQEVDGPRVAITEWDDVEISRKQALLDLSDADVIRLRNQSTSVSMHTLQLPTGAQGVTGTLAPGTSCEIAEPTLVRVGLKDLVLLPDKDALESIELPEEDVDPRWLLHLAELEKNTEKRELLEDLLLRVQSMVPLATWYLLNLDQGEWRYCGAVQTIPTTQGDSPMPYKSQTWFTEKSVYSPSEQLDKSTLERALKGRLIRGKHGEPSVFPIRTEDGELTAALYGAPTILGELFGTPGLTAERIHVILLLLRIFAQCLGRVT